MPGEGGSPGAEWDDLSCKAQGPYNARHNERSTRVDQSPGRLGRVRLSRANRLLEVGAGGKDGVFHGKHHDKRGVETTSSEPQIAGRPPVFSLVRGLARGRRSV
jgi:hypothetical protein